MVRVKIDFPEDIAKQRVEEAKLWEPGMHLHYEAQELYTEANFEKREESILIKTPHIEVELTNEEIQKIKEL